MSSWYLARDQRRQLPVGEVRGEDQRRLAVAPQLLKAIVSLGRIDDVAFSLRVGMEHLQAVDVGEFGGDTAEIVPDAEQDRFDLGGGFFRKSGGEVGAADPVLLEPRTERAHDAPGEVGHALAVGRANDAQHPDREPSKHRVGRRLGALAG